MNKKKWKKKERKLYTRRMEKTSRNQALQKKSYEKD